MTEPNAYTRRQFLHTGLALVSTLGSAPGFLTRSSLALADSSMHTASKPGVPQDRVLVVLQLSGGNDGLNTVVPFGLDAYHRARPTLSVRERDALVLDDKLGIGLHPSMQALHDMILQQRATIVQGVGYPNPNRSHFASMDIWHYGISPDEKTPVKLPRGTGWIGRALDSQADENALACIALGSEAPPATIGKHTKSIAFERSELFRWVASNHSDALHEAYAQLQQSPAQNQISDVSQFIYRTAMDAQVASESVREAVARKTETQMGGSPLSRQLANVANMIRAELPTRVYYVAMGGFDTHANQNGKQQNLLRDFSESVANFYKELDASGHAGRVMTLAFSEFGRRVTQNASGGTDHGTAGPLFVFGDHLRETKTGLIGAHPSLTNLDAGDLIHHTDFRTIYADLLGNWMKLDPVAALGGKIRPTKVIAAT